MLGFVSWFWFQCCLFSCCFQVLESLAWLRSAARERGYVQSLAWSQGYIEDSPNDVPFMDDSRMVGDISDLLWMILLWVISYADDAFCLALVARLCACTGSETCCASSEAYRQCSLRRHVMLGFHVETLRSRFDKRRTKRAPCLDGGPLQCNWHCCWDRCSAQVEMVEVLFWFEGSMVGKAINQDINQRSVLHFIDTITLE